MTFRLKYGIIDWRARSGLLLTKKVVSGQPEPATFYPLEVDSMGYLQNQDHFMNMLNKAIKAADYEIDYSKFLSQQFYIDNIYERGDGDSFTWQLHQQGASLLEEDNTLEWMSRNSHKIEYLLKKQPYAKQFSILFQELIQDLDLTPGVYNFCREDGKSLYVGKSIRLGQRMGSSVQRFAGYDRQLYVKYISTASQSDIAFLEAYFISKLKPPFNQDAKYDDKLNYKLTPMPRWASKIEVYEHIDMTPGIENGKDATVKEG